MGGQRALLPNLYNLLLFFYYMKGTTISLKEIHRIIVYVLDYFYAQVLGSFLWYSRKAVFPAKLLLQRITLFSYNSHQTLDTYIHYSHYQYVASTPIYSHDGLLSVTYYLWMRAETTPSVLRKFSGSWCVISSSLSW